MVFDKGRVIVELANCPRCGRLFAANFRDICPNCIKEIEREYEICVDYLREQKGANIQELSEATGVSVKQITSFVREGRISVVNAPNLMYPCEVCGTLIREGHMCDSCRTRLTRELSQAAQAGQDQDSGPRKPGEGAYRVVDKFHK
nr:TIGR03826 family flagellar region protein [Paenibacillus cellulositrophicus]